MRILGVSGSLRRDSHNRRLLRSARAELPGGVQLVEWDGLAGLPAFDEDLEDAQPPSVRAFLGAVAGADALLIATPEYNASVPGALKNALDWASRPFPDNVLHQKPTLVIGASTGLFGAVWAQAELRKALRASGATVLDAELPVSLADQAFRGDGSLADPRLRTCLRALLDNLIREAAPRGVSARMASGTPKASSLALEAPCAR
jgi:chromate reductase, NAD(P)H dehydrogenase (quinone)